MQTLLKFAIGLALLAYLVACQAPRSIPSAQLLGYFRPATVGDTLRFEIADTGTDAPTEGDTIPNALFFTTLDPALLQGIDYVADSATARVFGRQRFPINAGFDACLVDIRQFWFQHQSLLVYDKQNRRFTDRVTVAEWYGGDGGQVLTGSWMLDRNGDGAKDLVRREIQHAMIPDAEGEFQDTTHESAMQLIWTGHGFAEQPLSDTALVVKQFPIRSFW